LKHLSGMDAMFLHIESAEMPMHVGSLNVLDLPAGHAGDFFEDVKAFVSQRLHLATIFTRKLALMPFDLSDPVWVEDEDIDLDYHIRHVTLPRPGSNRQLQQVVARLHATLLDRSRPLWEFVVIDGLKSGQVALYTKVHHSGVDGQASVQMARAVFDATPTGRQVKSPRQRARKNQYQLGVAELASAAIVNTGRQWANLVKTMPAMARAAKGVLMPPKDEHGEREWPIRGLIEKGMAPRTPLNVPVTNQRTFAGRTVAVAEVKQIAKAFDVSFNDVVLATTAGALRRYLLETEELPKKPMTAAVPVSLREAGDDSANNQVSMLVVDLSTDEPDPLKRLKKICASSAKRKAMMSNMKSAIPTDFPSFAAPWLVSGMASLYGRSRLANVIPPVANVVISNVAGVPVPVYFAGAQVVSNYPLSILAHGMALNVTVQSYNGRLDYGLIACRRAMPDLAELGDSLLSEHRLLLDQANALSTTASSDQRTNTATEPESKAKPRRVPAGKTGPRVEASPAAKRVRRRTVARP
jgi:diacylglycerol O-acyltransferase / wax synthase